MSSSTVISRFKFLSESHARPGPGDSDRSLFSIRNLGCSPRRVMASQVSRLFAMMKKYLYPGPRGPSESLAART
jgi:hypothetical protein